MEEKGAEELGLTKTETWLFSDWSAYRRKTPNHTKVVFDEKEPKTNGKELGKLPKDPDRNILIGNYSGHVRIIMIRSIKS